MLRGQKPRLQESVDMYKCYRYGMKALISLDTKKNNKLELC